MPIGTSATDGVSRLGNSANNSPDSTNRALFLKQFAGEVLTSFEERNVFMPLHRVRTISNGKSAQFPVLGTATAGYHTAGDVIFGGSVDAQEITVTVDDLLVSATFIPKIDEAMNHYEVRSTYSKEMGLALSNAADENVASVIYQAAIAGNASDIESAWADADAAWHTRGNATALAGFISIASGADIVSGQSIVDGIITALQTFDSHDVTGEKYCVLGPAAYYALMGTDSVAINRDQGGNGSVAQGVVPTVAGVKILMSNHLPTKAQASSGRTVPLSGDSGRQGAYAGVGSFNANLGGLIFTKDAAATVKLLDLGVESEYQIDRQGTLMVSKYAMGHNILRSKSAIALTLHTTTTTG
tara:strand:- start:2967 stop:4037 length:1071 start_codon:yes stop_codon:yes gene_type:complete